MPDRSIPRRWLLIFNSVCHFMAEGHHPFGMAFFEGSRCVCVCVHVCAGACVLRVCTCMHRYYTSVCFDVSVSVGVCVYHVGRACSSSADRSLDVGMEVAYSIT